MANPRTKATEPSISNSPSFLRSLFPRLHNLEHLLLRNPLHLGQRHTKLGRRLLPLILNRARQGLCIRRLAPIKEILGQGRRRWLCGSGRFDVALFLLPNLLLHLYLFMMALLLVEFCSKACEGLRIFGEFVGFSGGSLAESLVVVKSMGGGSQWE